MASIQLNSITKSFGPVEVLKGIDIDIKDGEFVAFVGPSGCGKSTLLRLIAGLEEITSGDMHIGDKQVNDLPPKERGIAMVFQSYALYPHMTVYKNMAFGLSVAKKDQATIKERVMEAARILQLEDYLDRRPAQLSGGQRQRVAIGRAIVRNPDVFLFDEPLSNLDAALRASMRVELARLHGELKSTMIYVTHDQIEAMTLADKIVVLYDGVLQQVGTPLELYHQPRNLFVAGFIGSPKMNLVTGKVTGLDDEGLSVDVAGMEVPKIAIGSMERVAIGDVVTVGLRPNDINDLGEGDGRLTGRVSLTERLGNETVVALQTGEQANHQEWTAAVGGLNPVKLDDEISLNFHSRDLHVFDKDGMALDRLGLPDLVHQTLRSA